MMCSLLSAGEPLAGYNSALKRATNYFCCSMKLQSPRKTLPLSRQVPLLQGFLQCPGQCRRWNIHHSEKKSSLMAPGSFPTSLHARSMVCCEPVLQQMYSEFPEHVSPCMCKDVEGQQFPAPATCSGMRLGGAFVGYSADASSSPSHP